MNKRVVGILDYGVGNLKSVYNAVLQVGGEAIISNDTQILVRCDRIIVPGVGAFSHAMNQLKFFELIPFLDQYIQSGKPVLGICLGMQMFTQKSYEFGETNGLGYVPGEIRLLQKKSESQTLRLPHVGWQALNIIDDNVNILCNGIDQNSKFYFIHSFALQDINKSVCCLSLYEGIQFASIIMKDNVIGTQFHPERSGKQGLNLINNFLKI